MTEIKKRVARGAALLDEKRPGWEAMIDLSSLDISDPYKCILGQSGGWLGEKGETSLGHTPLLGIRLLRSV